MRIIRVILSTTALVTIAWAAAAAPAPVGTDAVAMTGLIDDLEAIKQWSVCHVSPYPNTNPHIQFGETFRFERVGTTDTVRLVPLSGTWEAGWWHLNLHLEPGSSKTFELNPSAWPGKCKGAGKDNPGEKETVADERDTARLVGDVCLPNVESDGTCLGPANLMHRFFVFLRPDDNGRAAGNHLYIEYCGDKETLNGHCNPKPPAAKRGFTPHPGHIHSDP